MPDQLDRRRDGSLRRPDAGGRTTIEVAELFSQQRLSNMLAATTSLADKFARQSRDSKNKALLKEFPGAFSAWPVATPPQACARCPLKISGLMKWTLPG